MKHVWSTAILWPPADIPPEEPFKIEGQSKRTGFRASTTKPGHIPRSGLCGQLWDGTEDFSYRALSLLCLALLGARAAVPIGLFSLSLSVSLSLSLSLSLSFFRQG